MSRHALSCLQNRRNFFVSLANGDKRLVNAREERKKINTSHTFTVPIKLISEYRVIIAYLSTET